MWPWAKVKPLRGSHWVDREAARCAAACDGIPRLFALATDGKDLQPRKVIAAQLIGLAATASGNWAESAPAGELGEGVSIAMGTVASETVADSYTVSETRFAARAADKSAQGLRTWAHDSSKASCSALFRWIKEAPESLPVMDQPLERGPNGWWLRRRKSWAITFVVQKHEPGCRSSLRGPHQTLLA